MLTVVTAAHFLDTPLTLPWRFGNYGVYAPVAVVGNKAILGNVVSFQYSQYGVEIYDAATGSAYVSLGHPVGAAVATVGHKAIFAGSDEIGFRTFFGSAPVSPSAAVDIYDDSTGLWTTATLSQPRFLMATATVGDTAIFAGGARPEHFREGDAASLSDAVDLYNDTTGRWTTATLSKPNAELSAVVAGTKALFADGAGGGSDIYDASTGRWSTSPFPSPRNQITAVAVGHFALFLDGSAIPTATSQTADLYDADTGTWSTVKLAGSVSSGKATAGPVAVAEGVAVIREGTYNGGDINDVGDVFDGRTGKWSTTAIPPSMEAADAATGVGAEAVFIDRGHSPVSAVNNIAHVYDTVTGKWSTTPLSQTLYDTAAFAVDGQVVTISTGDDVNADVLTPTNLIPPAAVSPAPDARPARSPRTFTWTAVLGADSYDVFVDDRLVAHVTTNHWKTNDVPPTGPHAWRVVAKLGTSRLWGLDTPFRIVGISGSVDQVNLSHTIRLNTVGTAKVTLRNDGDAELGSGATVSVYAVPSGGGKTVRLGKVQLHHFLRTGLSASVEVPLSLPAGFEAGSYQIVAVVRRGAVREATIQSAAIIFGPPAPLTAGFGRQRKFATKGIL